VHSSIFVIRYGRIDNFSSNVCKTVREVMSDAIFPLRNHIAIVEQIERDLRFFVAKVKMVRRHVLGVHRIYTNGSKRVAH
jgi:hypothetical protein